MTTVFSALKLVTKISAYPLALTSAISRPYIFLLLLSSISASLRNTPPSERKIVTVWGAAIRVSLLPSPSTSPTATPLISWLKLALFQKLAWVSRAAPPRIPMSSEAPSLPAAMKPSFCKTFSGWAWILSLGGV